MREIAGDLFSFRGTTSVLVIPVNGKVKYGTQTAVMGAGVARQAANTWQTLPRLLGQEIIAHGNVVHKFLMKSEFGDEWVATFPTKEHWADPAHLSLIDESARGLAAWTATLPEDFTVYLPRVGCGLGRLQWEEVRPILARYFDDRFVVVHQIG